MSEIIIKVQLDLSDAVKEFMASLMGGAVAKSESKSEPKSEQKATPAPTPTPAPAPASAPAPVPEASAVSREDLRQLVKAALIAEKESAGEQGGVKALLKKYGANNVTEVAEKDFVAIAADLTEYKNNLPPY